MSYPKKFDTSNLDKAQVSILEDFYKRRKLFDNYLYENKIELHTCPGCSYPTLAERGEYQICCVCNWEDDNQDDINSDEILEGPNYELSLTENRLNIGQQLAALTEEINGKINTDPIEVLEIISKHNKKVSEVLNNIAEDTQLNDSILRDKQENDLEILRQLVTM